MTAPNSVRAQASGRITWWLGDLLTGDLTYPIKCVSPSWSNVMDEAGSLSCTLPLADDEVAAIKPYTSAAPGKAFLAVSYTDPEGTETWLQAGPIWTHGWDDSSQQLAIGAGGLWSYFDHRKLIRVLSAGQNPALVAASYNGLSLGTIAKRLVELARSHTGGNVPVVLPADEAGTESRLYPGYELADIGPALKALTDIDGGPEIQFVPRASTTRPKAIEWEMRVGTAAAPLLTQNGDDWSWDLSAVRTAASKINVNRDGTATAGRVWSVGSGDAEAKLISRVDSATLAAAGYPLLEVSESRDGVEKRAILDGYATALSARSRRPVEAWMLTVQRDSTPLLGTYSVGDWARLRVAQHKYLPVGDYRSRITSISGDSSPQVQVQLQPTNSGGV